MVIFLLNVVLNIKNLSDRYCFCKRTSSILPCSTCQFRMVYLNDEFDIYENSLDMHFLVTFHRHLYKNLKRLLLETDSHLVCELVNKKYFYTHKDWFSRKVERFYIPNCLENFQNKKINKIKNNDLKVVLDPIDSKYQLFLKKLTKNNPISIAIIFLIKILLGCIKY